MSGVHASCVEQWIRHHRLNAVNSEAPRCSVCDHPYAGSEQRPGFSEFASEHARKCFAVALIMARLMLLCLVLQLLVLYTDLRYPFSIKVVIIAAFALCMLYKAAVLTVSVPHGRQAPERAYLQYFFVLDSDSLLMHFIEACVSFILVGLSCIENIDNLAYLLPFVAIFSVPLIKFAIENCSSAIEGLSLACLKEFLFALVVVILSPLIVLVAILASLALICRYPTRVGHPLDAGWHILVAGVTYVLTIFYLSQEDASNAGLVVMWIIHSVFLLGGLGEVFCVKHFTWRMGGQWWAAMMSSMFSWLLVNVNSDEFQRGFGERTNDTQTVVLAVSSTWCVLLAGLAVKVNWALLGRNYRIWQARHGRFTLDAAPTNTTEVRLVEEAANV